MLRVPSALYPHKMRFISSIFTTFCCICHTLTAVCFINDFPVAVQRPSWSVCRTLYSIVLHAVKVGNQKNAFQDIKL